MRRVIAIAAVAALAAACQPAPEPQSAAADPDAEVDGSVLAFAQAACGGCHAVEQYDLSPNPDAPEWPRIVNTPGLTAATLSGWLRDAHNYPVEMDFDLDAPQVDELVAYMMTLQRDDYEPPIQ